MLSVHGCLHVVRDPRSCVRSHHSGIAFVGIELLKHHGFHRCLASQVVGVPDFKLHQSSPDRPAINHLIGFGFISFIQLGQILGNAFIQLLLLVLEPLQTHMTPRGSNRLKLAAIDGHQLTGYQTGGSAELDEGTARRHKGRFVVFAKVGDGLEVGFEPVDQPHHFDVALTLGFEPPR